MDGFARHENLLRAVLIAERKRRGWSYEQLARAVAPKLGLERLSRQGVHAWEQPTTHPTLEQYAAWAAALGMALEVDVVPPDGLVAVRVPRSAADTARLFAALPTADQMYVGEMIRRLSR